jgi:hypothetical protein
MHGRSGADGAAASGLQAAADRGTLAEQVLCRSSQRPANTATVCRCAINRPRRGLPGSKLEISTQLMWRCAYHRHACPDSCRFEKTLHARRSERRPRTSNSAYPSGKYQHNWIQIVRRRRRLPYVLDTVRSKSGSRRLLLPGTAALARSSRVNPREHCTTANPKLTSCANEFTDEPR